MRNFRENRTFPRGKSENPGRIVSLANTSGRGNTRPVRLGGVKLCFLVGWVRGDLP